MAAYDLDFTSGTVIMDCIFAGTPLNADNLREIIAEMQDVLGFLVQGNTEGGAGA